MKSLARIWIVIALAHPLPVIAQEGAQLASCSYYQGEKVVKTDPSCIIYTVVDSLNKNKISLLFDKVELLQVEKRNLTEIISNLNAIIKNKEAEIQILNDTIKKQKKEIRKQKIIKAVALIGDVALPVATLFVGISIK
jgi:hypothetical protein